MSDIFPKFIIEDDCLILSKVTYHKDIVTDKSKVKGGGWFRYLNETDTFVFHGDSHEFGKAKLEDIIECVKNGNVFSDKFQCNNISNNHQFAYDTGVEIINL